jgi:3-oxoadipate enol-lactonase
MSVHEGVARSVDGARIAYSVRGDPDGPAVVLAHPLGLDRSVWEPVAERLGGEAGVVAYDCRGHGASDGMRPYAIGRFASDLLAVLDRLEIGRAVLAGCSLGGCVAQAFAVQHPKRAAGLALVDTTAWYGADSEATWRARAELARAKGLGALVDGQVARWFSDRFAAARPDVVAATRRAFLATEAETFAATCGMLGALDLRGALTAYQGAVAVVVGEEDLATPVAMAQALTDEQASATLTVIPGARHLTPLEAPEAVAEVLRGLIDAAFAGKPRRAASEIPVPGDC